MKIIGLLGKKGSGKNTVADMIKETDPRIIDLALADPLKWVCMLDAHIPEPDIQTKPPEVRKLLQWFGTEVGRSIDPNLWIKLLQARMMLVEKQWPSTSMIVITDVRFMNEVEAIKGMGGILWKINRPSIDDPNETHASEIEQDSISLSVFDCVISNIGTLEDLRPQVRTCLSYTYIK